MPHTLAVHWEQFGLSRPHFLHFFRHVPQAAPWTRIRDAHHMQRGQGLTFDAGRHDGFREWDTVQKGETESGCGSGGSGCSFELKAVNGPLTH